MLLNLSLVGSAPLQESIVQDTPKYKHDCDRCRFLGHILGYDVYTCNFNGRASLVARYGDEPASYASLLDDVFVGLLRDNGKVGLEDGKTIRFHELVLEKTNRYMAAWLIAIAMD